MDRSAQRCRTAAAFALAALALAGCATLRRKQDAPDAVAACRQLSREAIAALERGDPARGQTLLEEAVSASPTDVDARRQLAELLWQEGAAQEAAVHMEAAVRLDARHAPTLVRSGDMLLAMGATEKAQQRAEQALAIDPALASAWTLRARVFRRQGDNERALADLHQALRFNPHAPDALLDAAELQYELGRPQRALATVQCLLDAYPRGEEPQRALWLAGLAYEAIDRRQDAVVSLAAAVGRGPANPELLYQLARAQRAVGDDGAAMAAAQQAAAAGHEGGRLLVAQLQGVGDAPGGVIRR